VAIQTMFFAIPFEFVRFYNTAFRPAVYLSLAIGIFIHYGVSCRPVLKAYESVMVSVLSVILFGIVIVAVSFFFGAGMNLNMASPVVVAYSLWNYGVIVILGELVRYKLIKSANQRELMIVVFIVTLAITYGNMNTLRMFVIGSMSTRDVLFEVAFVHLVISSVASYFSIKGNFYSVVIIAFVYTMTPYLLPIVTPLVFSLIISGTAFTSAIIYYILVNENKKSQLRREKRTENYAKRPILWYATTALLISVTIAFFIGIFPIYPIVVLTGSMSGTFERGSIVLVERIPSNEAFTRVGEGEIIHFVSPNGVEYIHRVIDFRYDIFGGRQYITKGDASDLVDPFPVAQDEILGVVRAFFPHIGHPYIFFWSITEAFR